MPWGHWEYRDIRGRYVITFSNNNINNCYHLITSANPNNITKQHYNKYVLIFKILEVWLKFIKSYFAVGIDVMCLKQCKLQLEIQQLCNEICSKPKASTSAKLTRYLPTEVVTHKKFPLVVTSSIGIITLCVVSLIINTNWQGVIVVTILNCNIVQNS